MKFIEVSLPQYALEIEPKYDELGLIVDQKINENFHDGNYIIRAISSKDHPQITRDELIDKIYKLGTDKYDPTIKGIAHEEFKNYDYDIQATKIDIHKGKIIHEEDAECTTFFGQIIYDFYLHAPFDRGHPVRIDLLLIYKAEDLVQAPKITNEPDNFKSGLKQYLFKFRDKNSKKESLEALILIK